MTEQHLNSAQINQVKKEIEGQMERFMERIQLRKWSMEQALAAGQLPGNSTNIVDRAREIYEFVSVPAKAEISIS